MSIKALTINVFVSNRLFLPVRFKSADGTEHELINVVEFLPRVYTICWLRTSLNNQVTFDHIDELGVEDPSASELLLIFKRAVRAQPGGQRECLLLLLAFDLDLRDLRDFGLGLVLGLLRAPELLNDLYLRKYIHQVLLAALTMGARDHFDPLHLSLFRLRSHLVDDVVVFEVLLGQLGVLPHLFHLLEVENGLIEFVNQAVVVLLNR